MATSRPVKISEASTHRATGSIPGVFRNSPLKFGTSGRDIITAPSWTNFDISAFKNFSVTERAVLQFRAEAFDAFNYVKFFPPDMSVVSPTFATLQSADPPARDAAGFAVYVSAATTVWFALAASSY